MSDGEQQDSEESEQELREILRTQQEAVDQSYRRMGALAYLEWGVLEKASYALDPGDRKPLTEQERKAASSALRGLLHNMASSRYMLDHERRDAEVTRARLRRLREEKRRKDQP